MGRDKYAEIQRTLRYFERFGIFRKADDNNTEPEPYKSVQEVIDDNYMSFTSSCMTRAQGNQREADYLMDCSYFEYYWRIVQYNQYCKQQEEAIERAKNKNR